MLSLIALVAMPAITKLGTNSNQTFSNVNASLQDINTSTEVVPAESSEPPEPPSPYSQEIANDPFWKPYRDLALENIRDAVRAMHPTVRETAKIKYINACGSSDSTRPFCQNWAVLGTQSNGN